MPTFDDATTESLFGAEDAENERPERFRQYFFYNKAYDSLTADLPLRILVGHKGIGKSALLRRAYLDDLEKEQLAIWIRPNDLVPRISGTQTREFNELIEDWKAGLLAAIADRILQDTLGDTLQDSGPSHFKKGIKVLYDIIQTHFDQHAKGTIQAAKKSVVQNFLKSGRATVYIDDVDRGWSASRDNIHNISALLNAIRDISGSDQKIKFRIGLRTDVYYLVRTSDESTDKIERHVIWLDWTNHEILAVMAKRIETFLGKKTTQEQIIAMQQGAISQNILSNVIDPIYKGAGHWSNRAIHNVLLSLTRKRPRDLVKLMHGAARNAYHARNEIISSSNLTDAFEPYSHERLQDIINEFKSEMPNIEALLLSMRPTKKQRRTAESFLFTTASLTSKLREIMFHTTLYFTNGRPVTPKSLIQFLYKIDFITARRDTGSMIDRKYFDQSRFLANEIVDFGYDWEVHPAYRWALNPTDIQEVIDSLGK